MEKEIKKAKYEKPIMIEHGDVKKLTLQLGYANRDSIDGPNDSAFPNAS